MLFRILALDLGKKRIGLAASDLLGVTAQGLPTYARVNLRVVYGKCTQTRVEDFIQAD